MGFPPQRSSEWEFEIRPLRRGEGNGSVEQRYMCVLGQRRAAERNPVGQAVDALCSPVVLIFSSSLMEKRKRREASVGLGAKRQLENCCVVQHKQNAGY